MNEEKLLIKRFTRVFTDEKGHYWFNIGKFADVVSKNKFDINDLIVKIETTVSDDNKTVSYRSLGRLFAFVDSMSDTTSNEQTKQLIKEQNKKKTKPDDHFSISTLKLLGTALCGNEYAFLINIEPNNILMLSQQAEKLWGRDELNNIFNLMVKILYEYEASQCYNFKPGTDEDGYDYYDTRLQNIRTEIDSHFWNKPETRTKLHILLDELEECVKSYTVPGAAGRWVEANPKIKYYDCVYEIMSDIPETYMQVKDSDSWVHFGFYPTYEELLERDAYFEGLRVKCDRLHTVYSEERCYQNELIEAFTEIFQKDFANEKNCN